MNCYHCFEDGFIHFSPLFIKITPDFGDINSVTGNLSSRNHLKCRKSFVHKGIHCREGELLNGIKVTSSYDILLKQRTGYSYPVGFQPHKVVKEN